MGLFSRIVGISRTRRPEDPECWKYSKGKVVIEWARAPELRTPCGAIRLEGRGLPDRILVVYGMDGEFHAFRNRCPHWGGRLDPVPGSAAVHCFNLSGSTFDYAGNRISGVGDGTLKTYPVKTTKCRVIIRVE